MGQPDNYALLRRAIEPTTAPAGDLCYDSFCEHVDAQCGNSNDDDASGNWDLTELAAGSCTIPYCQEVLQSCGSWGDILYSYWRDKHTYRDRCQPYIGGNVEELLP